MGLNPPTPSLQIFALCQPPPPPTANFFSRTSPTPTLRRPQTLRCKYPADLPVNHLNGLCWQATAVLFNSSSKW